MLRKELNRGLVTVRGCAYTLCFRMNGGMYNEPELYTAQLEVSEVEAEVRESYRIN